MIVPEFDRTYTGWRDAARRLLFAYIRPEDVLWSREPALFDDPIPHAPVRSLDVPKEFLQLAETVAVHADDGRWGLLYRVLYRLVNGEKYLLKIESDPDVHRLLAMYKQVTHDMHRMKASCDSGVRATDYCLASPGSLHCPEDRALVRRPLR
jgi:DNA polymerase